MYKDMSIEELSEKFVNNLVETNRGFNFYVDWNNAMASSPPPSDCTSSQ